MEKQTYLIFLHTIYFIRQTYLKILLFLENNLKKEKAPQQKAKGLEIGWLPLLETLRTFKEDIAIENIRLIS